MTAILYGTELMLLYTMTVYWTIELHVQTLPMKTTFLVLVSFGQMSLIKLLHQCARRRNGEILMSGVVLWVGRRSVTDQRRGRGKSRRHFLWVNEYFKQCLFVTVFDSFVHWCYWFNFVLDLPFGYSPKQDPLVLVQLMFPFFIWQWGTLDAEIKVLIAYSS